MVSSQTRFQRETREAMGDFNVSRASGVIPRLRDQRMAPNRKVEGVLLSKTGQGGACFADRRPSPCRTVGASCSAPVGRAIDARSFRSATKLTAKQCRRRLSRRMQPESARAESLRRLPADARAPLWELRYPVEPCHHECRRS